MLPVLQLIRKFLKLFIKNKINTPKFFIYKFDSNKNLFIEIKKKLNFQLLLNLLAKDPVLVYIFAAELMLLKR